MILYELQCANRHNFEAWFKDGATYDSQAKHGEVECPLCSDTVIEKAPMAPRVAKSGLAKDTGKAAADGSGEHRASEVAREILTAMKKVREHVEKNNEYVGDKFADEARAIHIGDAEERGIYGEATAKEAEELADEDIAVHRLPWWTRRNS